MIECMTEYNKEYWKDSLHPDISEHIGRKFYKGLMALDSEEAKVIGFLVWENKNIQKKEESNQAELIDFYAKDEETAKRLLEEYGKEAKQEAVKTTYFEARSEWDEVVLAELRKSGFTLTEKDSKTVSISIGELSRLPIMQKNLLTPKIVSLSELSMLQLRNALLNCVGSNMIGDLEDLAYLPISWYEIEVSACVLADGTVNGFLLIHKTPSGKLEVKVLYGAKSASQIELLQMIQYSITKGKECYDENTPVIIKCCNDTAKELVKKLFQRDQNRKAIWGSRMEH